MKGDNKSEAEQHKAKSKSLLNIPYDSVGALDITEHIRNQKQGAKQSTLTFYQKGSDKILIFIIILLIVGLASFFVFAKMKREQPKTLEELHLANLRHKLKPEQGYLYKGIYSFVKVENFWFMQLQSKSGKSLYDVSMRYSPRELEGISISGQLNDSIFNEAKEYYITFNPAGNDFSHVALAVGDFNEHLIKSFNKMAIAACDKEADECKERPIIDCKSTKGLVIYVKESNQTKVYYDDNCIVVEGNGFELVKGADRSIYNLYGIMEK